MRNWIVGTGAFGLCALALTGGGCGGSGTSGTGAVNSGTGGGGGSSVAGGILETYEVDLATGTFLGGIGDAGVAVGFGANGQVIVAANLASDPAGVNVTTLGTGTGVVLRYAADARTIQSGVRLNGAIRDMEVSPTGGVAVTGDGFTGVLNTTVSGFVWSNAMSGVRVAIGDQEGLAVLDAGKTVSLFDAFGTAGASWTLTDTQVDDLAYTQSFNRVIVTGFRQVSASLKLPTFRAYTSAGAVAWDNYAWSASEANAQSLGADSEGFRVHVGRDNRVYLLGRTDGGNTVFQRNPTTLNVTAPNFTPNDFQQPVNLSGAAKFVYLARFDPTTGTIQLGTFLLARLMAGTQNTVEGFALAADAQGNLAVTGHSRFSIRNSTLVTVSGVQTTAAGPYVAVLDSNFAFRTWTTFATTDTGDLTGVAIDSRGVALVGAEIPSQMVTDLPLQSTPGSAWVGLFANTGP